MSLSSTIQTALEGRTIRCAHLVEFGLKTQTRRVWNGSYKLNTGGHNWFGLRKLGSIEGIDDDGMLQASDMRFTVSGVDSRFLNIVQLAVGASEAEYKERLVKVFLQFFDADWKTLDAPVARAVGIMDRVEVTRTPLEDGSSRRTTSIIAHNVRTGRRLPKAGYFTDTDQKLRSSGDRGLEPVAGTQETIVQVPW